MGLWRLGGRGESSERVASVTGELAAGGQKIQRYRYRLYIVYKNHPEGRCPQWESPQSENSTYYQIGHTLYIPESSPEDCVVSACISSKRVVDNSVTATNRLLAMAGNNSMR